MFSLAGNPSGAGGDVPRGVRARHLPHHHRQHAVHARVRKQHGPLPSTGPSNSTFQVGTGYQKIINCTVGNAPKFSLIEFFSLNLIKFGVKISLNFSKIYQKFKEKIPIFTLN